MIMTIVGIFDRKAQAFISMTATAAIGVAAREFTEAVNTAKDSPLYKWPEDHELYELGVYDTETGMVQHRVDEGAMYSKKLIITGDAVKVREETGGIKDGDYHNHMGRRPGSYNQQ